MARPTLKVSVAFATNPLATTPAWTDISAYVCADQPISIRRGRQQELGRFEAGMLTLALNNLDRRFDPTNTSSPYAPNVVPNRKIKVEAIWNSTTYPLFTGYIDEWPPEWPLTGDARVTIRATDAFKLFARKKITLWRQQEHTHWRVWALLNAIGWPDGDRRMLYTGTTLIQELQLTRTPILQHLQDIAMSDNGDCYMDADGYVVYRNRHWRLTNATSTVSQATFGDIVGELPYTNLIPTYDESLLYNDIVLNRLNGSTPATASDASSQDSYFPLTLERSGYLLASDAELADAASWLLYQYRQPKMRFQSLTMDGQANDAIWNEAINRTIGDRITARKRPPGGGLLEQDCFIDAVEHRITATAWSTTWQLSACSATSFFVFDHTTLGRFDFNAFGY